MNRLETFPPALPLDGADVIASASDWQLVLFAIGFSIVCLGLAFFAAVMFSRSAPPARRVRRTTHAPSGVGLAPEATSAPLPNLLHK